MSNDADTLEVFRFSCPHCRKVMRVPLDRGGTPGTCPHCREKVAFPEFRKPSGSSATTKQLLKQLSAEDDPSVDEAAVEKLSLYLSQGTCRDYAMAHGLLKKRALSARQWRKVLNNADLRERMRLRLEQRIEGDASEEPIALEVAGEVLSSRAWEVLARFLYFQRHPTCEGCKKDPTGMECVYLTFEDFLTRREIASSRAGRWRTLLQHQLGL